MSRGPLLTAKAIAVNAGRARLAMRWKSALNAFSTTFADRFPSARRTANRKRRTHP